MNRTGERRTENFGLPAPTPFERLARAHTLMVAGETAMAVALADSMFLNVSPSDARPKVILFLLVSIAPFAVISPVIAPFIDRIRGGHRMVVMVVGVLRALVLVGMAFELDSWRLFPLAFSALILGKTYAIAKSALVPTTVSHHDELVEANSKLGRLAGITGFIVAPPALLLQKIDTRAALILGGIAFIGATLNAYRLPKIAIATEKPQELETTELHSRTVVNAANSMRFLRGIVGFMFFHLAFWLRSEDAGTAWFGVAIAIAGLATLGANFVGPHIRKKMREPIMLFSALIAIMSTGIFAVWYNRIVGGIVLAAVVNASAAIGRLAFESIVQSDAPDANRGRAFARFETHNQLAWVVGGLIPIALNLSSRMGFVFVMVGGLMGALLFVRTGGVTMKSRGGRATGQEHPPR